MLGKSDPELIVEEVVPDLLHGLTVEVPALDRIG